MMMLHAYQITDRPGATIYIGIPPGRVRPAMWIKTAQTGETVNVILSQFHGEREAMAAVNFFDAMALQIQRVINHLANGDDSEEPHD